MDENIADFQQALTKRKAEEDAEMFEFFLNLPPTLTPEQCSQGRAMLGWSQEALAFRSGASIKAIRQFESGHRELRDVTKQALAFALEAEGLVFIPGHAPLIGQNARGCTANPRARDDFHLIE